VAPMSTTTATTTQRRALEPSPNLYGHHVDPVPAGCVLLPVDELQVGDVLQYAPGTFDLVTSIAPIPTPSTRKVHVLRTMPNGRTATCFFWVGEHARRTVHLVSSTPTE
jgi:hypothetical protein